ncbi:MAG: alpha/beta hydrolase [Actinomycetota bacterium]
MPFVDVADIAIHHLRLGEGEPLLMISGSGGDLRETFPEAHPLNRHFDTVHYDQRGLGQTTAGDHPPTMADFADDAAGLCAALGWDRCRVVGTSFGGMVAQHLAIRHPELVERMVLNCTSPGGDLPSFPLHDAYALPAPEAAELRLRLTDTRYETEGTLPGLEMLVPRYRNAGEPSAGFHAQLAARAAHDATAGLASIQAPALVCSGRYDGIAPVANGERLAELIPDAEFDVFEGGHLFMFQDRRSRERTLEFLLA